MACKLAAPVGFCRGFGPRFRVHLSRHACSLCGFFRCFRLFGGFFEANWFLTLIAFDKKDNAVPMQSGVRVFGRGKTNYIIAKHVYTRRFLRDRSFLGVFILDRAWPVWSGCDISRISRAFVDNIIYSVYEHDFESPWLWDVNRKRGNSYISLALV